MDQVNLWKTAFKKFEVFFEGCLPQILLGPFLNTLTHLYHKIEKTLMLLININDNG